MRRLQGLALKNVTLTLEMDGKKLYEGFGEMLFTHFGISGPLVLSASSYYSAALRKLAKKGESSRRMPRLSELKACVVA